MRGVRVTGVALFHDGANNYSAVTLDEGSSSIEHLDFTSGSGWGSALATSSTITINNETSYELRGFITQRHVTAWVVGQSNQVVYDRSTSRTRNRFGLVATKTGVTFDDFKLYQPTPHDPAAPGWIGLAATTLDTINNKLTVTGSTRGRLAVSEWVGDDDYIAQANVQLNSGTRLSWRRGRSRE